jgi:AcrR family transcriptional regulator
MGAAKKPTAARKRPTQERSRRTVEWILTAAARIFRAEGFDATTNRVARAAGVSIGTLYEYFPNKESLLVALAERHVSEAERGVGEALAEETSPRELVRALYEAILASHRYPSQAIEQIADEPQQELRKRVATLRTRILRELQSRARTAGHRDHAQCAEAIFTVACELPIRASYEKRASTFAEHLLEMATRYLER